MNTAIIKTIEWKDDAVIMIDQRKLPHEEIYLTYTDYKGVADAIRTMVVRGAPAIGVAAAMGVAIGAFGIGVDTFHEFYKKLLSICETIGETRPTAVNLFWAIERMKATCLLHQHLPVAELKQRLKEEALRIYHEDIEANRAMGRHGAVLFNSGDTVMTHCNAGALATAGFGTALGVLYTANEMGKSLKVYANETRPFLQGARLTAWELQKYGMDVTVACDNMAGHLMAHGKIGRIIVGADRIAANGDVANKIGTYSLAILAHYHHIPFYVAAPLSTIDINCPTGKNIPIEERSAEEVTHFRTIPVTPTHVRVVNPSFDVTPAQFVTAIITEKGIIEPPYSRSIAALLE